VHLRIKPVSSLNAVTLIDLGTPRGITGWSYVAGSVHMNVTLQLNLRMNSFSKIELIV